MRKKIILLFLLLYCTTTLSFSQKSTMTKMSKAYNGLYIFNDQLKEIFPVADVKYIDKTIKSSLNSEYYKNTTYLIVTRTFFPLAEDLVSLKGFLNSGNDVIISATFFNETIYNFFDFETTIKDSMNNIIQMKEVILPLEDTIRSKYLNGIINSFSNFNKNEVDVLGKNYNGTPNLIRIRVGSGNLYIHLYPDVFTNGFILDKKNYKYTESLLSYLDKYTSNLLIRLSEKRNDAYTGGGGGSGGSGAKSIFDFLRNDANLWPALLVTLGTFCLLVLFGLKRRQSIINVVEPTSNKTMELAKTMGDLYFNSKNNDDIANKKIQYWLEHVRTKYQMPTMHLSPDFWEKLTKKSGASNELVKNIEQNILLVRTGNKVSDRLLVQLNNNIDQFYKS